MLSDEILKTKLPNCEEVISNKRKRIISFDIGIKNIAFCIIDTFKKEKYNIIDWKVENLLPLQSVSSLPKQQCSCNKVKSLIKCNHPAIYVFDNKYFCKVHAKSANIALLPKRELLNKLILKKKKSELILLILENSITDINGEFYIKDTIQKSIKKELIDIISRWRDEKYYKTVLEMIAPVIPQKNANNTDLITICREMVNVMNLCPAITDDITEIIIENQIGTLATRMRCLQTGLTVYFAMRFPNISIKYVSSRNKLRGATYITPQEENITASKIYSNHKKDAVKYTEEILETKILNGEEWMMMFSKQKKRDDFADCLTQCIWFIENYNK